jgi:nucleoside-diphosphate-sugar epimerase
MAKKTAVIAGASGLIGRRIADRLLAGNEWEVIGLARRARARRGMHWLAVDLADRSDVEHKLGGLAPTHVFYAARYDHPVEGKTEDIETNTRMLTNLVDIAATAGRLEHVHALHGSKWYGHQLGPVKLPLEEDASARSPVNNYYFEQDAFLRAASAGKAWGWLTTRPHAFCDPAVDLPRSIGLVIAVYAEVQRELGLPLDFPGNAKGYAARTQFTDLGLLARAILWMSEESRCRNQAFNVVNGDNPRWGEIWEKIARWFNLPVGQPRSIKLVDYMADKAPVWDAVIKKHDLRAPPLQQVALWAYGDYQFRPDWDVVSSMQKARALGFSETLDSFDMFARQFENYRKEKIIP